MGKEKNLRETCRRLVTKKGGVLLPLRGWLKGTPDALLVAGGKITLIEFKAPDGRLSPAQELMARRLQDAGAPVAIIRTIEQFKELL